MRRRQKQQIFIGVFIGLFVIAVSVLGIIFYNHYQKEQINQRLAANTVHFASDGYNIAATMLLPKDQYSYEIKSEERPRFPTMTIKDKGETYTITAKIAQVGKASRANDLEAAKKRGNFTELKADKATGALGGYAYDDNSYHYIVKIPLVQRNQEWYELHLDIENISNASGSKTLFESSSIQSLVKSVRYDSNYQAPDQEYTSDDREIVKVNKFANEIDGFSITQRSSADDKITFVGTRNNVQISLTVRPVSTSKTLEQATADDYYVKAGTHKYDQITKYNSKEVRHTAPQSDPTSYVTFFYYFEKDGVILQGAGRYNAEGKNAFDQMAKTIFETVQVDKARAKKYVQ